MTSSPSNRGGGGGAVPRAPAAGAAGQVKPELLIDTCRQESGIRTEPGRPLGQPLGRVRLAGPAIVMYGNQATNCGPSASTTGQCDGSPAVGATSTTRTVTHINQVRTDYISLSLSLSLSHRFLFVAGRRLGLGRGLGLGAGQWTVATAAIH